MKNKILIVIIFILLNHCTSINQDLADEDQKNWCIANLNLLISNGTNNRFTDENFKVDTNRISAWEILKQDNIIPGDNYFRDQYAGGDKGLWTSYEYDFLNTYEDDLNSNIKNQNTWDYADAMLLNKYFLNDNNESALRHCKVWKDITQ